MFRRDYDETVNSYKAKIIIYIDGDSSVKAIRHDFTSKTITHTTTGRVIRSFVLFYRKQSAVERETKSECARALARSTN